MMRLNFLVFYFFLHYLKVPGTCPAPGKCQNLMGSFVCSCPPGFELLPDGNTCAGEYSCSFLVNFSALESLIFSNFPDVNECLADENLCDEGDCINTEGSFRCECPRGYVLSPDGKKCVDIREELCFNTFRRGSCSDPRSTTMTKTQCCCTMGGAWGNGCEKCPSEGSRKFQLLLNLIYLPQWSVLMHGCNYIRN